MAIGCTLSPTRYFVLPACRGPIRTERKEQQMHAKYPKILPWLAKKAGVPLKRAEVLWGNALRHATQKAAVVESPEYWKLAVEGVIDLITAESRELRARPFGFGPMVRLPAQLWLHSMTAQQAMVSIAANSAHWWQRRTC